MTKKAKIAKLQDDETIQAILQGLKPAIRQYVIQRQPTTCEDVAQHAKLAEASMDCQSETNEDTLVAIID